MASTPKIRKAVIPAAGLGTRFLPATKMVAKELMPIVDKPSIQLIVEEAIAAGLDEIIFVISPDKQAVLNHFLPAPELEAHLQNKNQTELLEKITPFKGKVQFSFVIQDKPLGLGHAVACAREAVGNEWFFVFLPDDLVQ